MGKNKKLVYKFFSQKNVRAYCFTIVGSIIYAATVVWILNLGELYSGGVTGIAQIIVRLTSQLFGATISLAILILLINIPLLFIGWKYISRHFFYLTLISIIAQTIVIFVLEQMSFQPFSILMSEQIKEIIRDPNTGQVIDIVTVKGLASGSRLLLAMLGGALSGVGSAICLSSGGSTGGMDIISNTLFVRKNISFTMYSLAVEVVIILMAGISGFEAMLYTFVRLIIYIVTVGRFYTIYKIAKLEIVSTKASELREILLQKHHHGLTIYPAKGGYTLQERNVIEIYVSSYEVKDYLQTITAVDEKAFVVVLSVISIKGNYQKKTIT